MAGGERRTPGAGRAGLRLADVDAAFGRLRALDPAAVARSVQCTALADRDMVDLVAHLLDRLALQIDRAERSTRVLRALDLELRAGAAGPDGDRLSPGPRR